MIIYVEWVIGCRAITIELPTFRLAKSIIPSLVSERFQQSGMNIVKSPIGHNQKDITGAYPRQ
jgi:hypothetical protein